jgi:hypothetical protein
MKIFKFLINLSQVVFYYLILFAIGVANVFIFIAGVTNSDNAGSSDREQQPDNERMMVDPAN